MSNDLLQEKIESLSNIISQIDDNVKFNITTMWGVFGIAIAILGGAAYFLIRNMINDTINKEIDLRLLDLLKKNEPVFKASGVARPDLNKKIYLSADIHGIDQLVPEKVLIIQLNVEAETWGSMEGGGLKSVIRKKEDGTVEIEIPDYYENNGNVTWNLMWPRTKYQSN
jgi:hypothetical protein